MATETRKRTPFHGSCHCGLTRYIVYITLPPATAEGSPTCIYKCNCSTCHKAGHFHVRTANAPEDFLVLSPLDEETGTLKVGPGGLGDYTAFDHDIHWYFCTKCGARCFLLDVKGDKGEIKSVPASSLPPEPERYLHKTAYPLPKGGEVKVWSPKKETWSKENCYLSVNAMTLEPGQEGLDLREWHEKGWIEYMDTWKEEGEERLREPHEGGCY
jgi:hypothetical protein